jgi:hypothetical protein
MLNISFPTIRTILIFVGIIIFALVAIKVIASRLGLKIPAEVGTWKSYLTGQGMILFVFLVLGGGLAWASSYYGPHQGKVSQGGQLIEFRQLNPSEHVLYERQNVENYSQITVLTRTISPQNGSATIIIYGDQDEENKVEIKRIESISTSWSRWDQENSNKHINLIIEPSSQQGATSATQVDVLLFLSGKR